MLEKDVKMIVEIKKDNPEEVTIKPVEGETFNAVHIAHALLSAAVILLSSLPEEVSIKIVKEAFNV